MGDGAAAPGSPEPPDAADAAEAADAADDLDLRPGTLVGEYRVERKIGEGGMGAVFAAVHPLIGRRVAIKVLNAFAGGLASGPTRFLQEARAASLVRHRNVVDVFAFGQLDDGRSYLVMEFLDGETLSAYLWRRGPLGLRAALSILEGVFAALGVAHGRGVIHRDLKPENIWILPADEEAGGGADGADPDAVPDALRVKVLDFGLAKVAGGAEGLTRAGAPLGTPAFMSPEQCRGDAAVDARSDVYALGVILFQMLSLRLPFSGPTFIDVAQQHLHHPPPSLEDLMGVPAELAEVVDRALAKAPDDRFQTVAAMRDALRACTRSLDWSPLPPARPSAARHGEGSDETQVGPRAAIADTDEPGAPPAADDRGGAGLPPLDLPPLRIDSELDRGTLTVRISGELDEGCGGPELATYLGLLIDRTQDDLRRVVLDLAGVGYLGLEAVACLGDWLAFLREARAEGLAPTTVRYQQAAGGQRQVVASLERVDPALRSEPVA